MSFARKLIRWQRSYGRHHLPWQGTRDPYRVWLSEVMLQQTQVAAAIPYYERFLQRYPSVAALAAASEDDVLRLWSGLGYYARGRNLHKAAQLIRDRGFPTTAERIAELPGVGRSTAAAIAVFAFGERAAILDGNAKRVLARRFGTEEKLWILAERLLPAADVEAYTQALMDLGATLCVRVPQCAKCPVKADCVARNTGRTAELPAPKAKRVLPQKSVTWFVYRAKRAVLLERRPAPGIWGGLWCFPERATLRVGPGIALKPIEHGFTHFRLRIRPVLHETTRRAGGAWLDVDEAIAAAVPTPVKKLLQDLKRTATVRARKAR